MNKLIPLLFLIVALSACKKQENNVIVGCIEKSEYNPSQVLLTAANQAAAAKLFQQNNIPVTNLQFTAYYYDNGNYVLPGPYETVRTQQHFNGLPLFISDAYYSFLNGVVNSQSNTMSAVTAVNLDTQPKLNLNAVRSFFLDYMRDYAPTYNSVKDSCLTAQLGYFQTYNANTKATIIIKAWKVKLKNQQYPALYLKDTDGASLWFDMGFGIGF